MSNYVFLYQGGSMPTSPAEQKKVFAAWSAWFGELGESVVDGGNPFGPSSTVSSKGEETKGASSGVTGYTIIKADNLKTAVEIARKCPVLASGASIDVCETVALM